jgi:hypothetical protein
MVAVPSVETELLVLFTFRFEKIVFDHWWFGSHKTVLAFRD